MILHFAENLNCLLKDRKEYVQRHRNEPTEHNGVFSFKLFDPTNVIFIVFEHTYPVDALTHTLTHITILYIVKISKMEKAYDGF